MNSSELELQPHLIGKLIELRPLKRDDFSDLYQAAADPLIWEQHPEPDRYTRDVFKKYFDGGIESGGAFVVIEKRTGKIIGSSRFYNSDPLKREVMIGFTFLERAFWGGDYNRELKALMLDHAFRFVDRVFFEVGENNLRSQKALGKIGATFLKRVSEPKPNLIFVISR